MTTDIPLRTSRADKNFLSYNGDTLVYFLGTDHPEVCPRFPVSVVPALPSEWDSALKVSNNTFPIYVPQATIAQCNENALDINRGHTVNITATFGRAGEIGDQVITVKGGSTNITLSGLVVSNGTNGMVVIGNWSDQSSDPSRDIDLSGLYRIDGKPITVILARVKRDTVKLPPKARVLWVKSVGYVVYWWLKRAYVGLLRLIKRY